jgi:hypothetical protein
VVVAHYLGTGARGGWRGVGTVAGLVVAAGAIVAGGAVALESLRDENESLLSRGAPFGTQTHTHIHVLYAHAVAVAKRSHTGVWV